MTTLNEAFQAVQSVSFMLRGPHRKLLDVVQAHLLGLASTSHLTLFLAEARESGPTLSWASSTLVPSQRTTVRAALATASTAILTLSEASVASSNHPKFEDMCRLALLTAKLALEYVEKAKSCAGTLRGPSYSDLQSLWDS